MFRNVKNFQDSRTFQIIMQGVMIALSVGSILTASFAFYYMNQTNSQTDYIINNWNTKPIVHAVMVTQILIKIAKRIRILTPFHIYYA